MRPAVKAEAFFISPPNIRLSPDGVALHDVCALIGGSTRLDPAAGDRPAAFLASTCRFPVLSVAQIGCVPKNIGGAFPYMPFVMAMASEFPFAHAQAV